MAPMVFALIAFSSLVGVQTANSSSNTTTITTTALSSNTTTITTTTITLTNATSTSNATTVTTSTSTRTNTSSTSNTTTQTNTTTSSTTTSTTSTSTRTNTSSTSNTTTQTNTTTSSTTTSTSTSTSTASTSTSNLTLMPSTKLPEETVFAGMPATRIYVVDDSQYYCAPGQAGDKLRVWGEHGFNFDTYCVGKGSIIVQPAFPGNVSQWGTGVLVQKLSPSPNGAVGNDPIAWYGKESREFWLPVGMLTPILHTQHLSMLASTFVGSPREQWMDRIVVTNADGFRLADIRIRKNLNSFNRSKVRPNSFETIELTLGMTTTPLKEYPPDLPGRIKGVFSRMDVSVAVDKLSEIFAHNSVPFQIDQTHIGKARREAVVVTSPHARFLVVSSPATEYYGDFAHLSVEYAHLDIHILDMRNRGSIRGLLPELWGLKKMSNRTKELTCPPWSTDASTKKTEGNVDSEADWQTRFVV